MHPTAPARQPPEPSKHAATALAYRHRLEAGPPQLGQGRTVPGAHWIDAEGGGPLLPARPMRTAVTVRVGGGQVVTGMRQFVQQGHGQQSGFLTWLQTDAVRFGAVVQVGAEQADGMRRTHRQEAETIEQLAGGITRLALPNPGGDSLPDLKFHRQTVDRTV